MKAKVKKGDTVKILLGRDAGRQGKVIRVFAKKGQVLVEGINQVKRHIKRQNQEQPGGIVEIEKPLNLSKVKKVTPMAPAKSAAKKTVKKNSKSL